MTTNDYICGTCKHDYTINCFKYKRDGYKNWKNKQDTCDDWTDPDEPNLTYDGGVMSNFDNENPKEVEDYKNEGREIL